MSNLNKTCGQSQVHNTYIRILLGVVYSTTPASPSPKELVATTENK